MNRFWEILKAGYESAEPSQRLFGNGFGGSNWGLGGADFDYRSGVGKGYDNTAVYACINFMAGKFSQSTIKLATTNKLGEYEWARSVPQSSAGVLEALNKPNAYYSASQLWWATIASLATSERGAFWYRLQDRAGRTVGFYHLPSENVTPRNNGVTQDGFKIITHYDVTSAAGTTFSEPYENIVHLRWALDPVDSMLSYAPLAPIMREVYSDNEAATFTGALLRNKGVPGHVISPRGGKDITPPSREFMEDMEQKLMSFTRENRGKNLGLRFPVELTQLGFDPDKMVLDKVRNMASDRVCAAFGFDPMAVNLPSQSKTYSNVQEAKLSAILDTIMPLMDDIAQQLDTQLLQITGNEQKNTLRWDYSQIPQIEEDRQGKESIERTMDREDFLADKITRAEFRQRAGLPTNATDNVYYSQIQAQNSPLGLNQTLAAQKQILKDALRK